MNEQRDENGTSSKEPLNHTGFVIFVVCAFLIIGFVCGTSYEHEYGGSAKIIATLKEDIGTQKKICDDNISELRKQVSSNESTIRVKNGLIAKLDKSSAFGLNISNEMAEIIEALSRALRYPDGSLGREKSLKNARELISKLKVSAEKQK